MPEPTHTIRLRGPWQVSVFDHSGNQRISRRVKIRQPSDWWSWLAELEVDMTDWKELVFQRSFNWPQPNPVPADVKLLIEGNVQTPTEVLLNQQPLVIPATPSTEQRIVISNSGETGESGLMGLLKSSNDLRVRFAASDILPGQGVHLFKEMTTGVSLRIVDRAE